MLQVELPEPQSSLIYNTQVNRPQGKGNNILYLACTCIQTHAYHQKSVTISSKRTGFLLIHVTKNCTCIFFSLPESRTGIRYHHTKIGYDTLDSTIKPCTFKAKYLLKLWTWTPEMGQQGCLSSTSKWNLNEHVENTIIHHTLTSTSLADSLLNSSRTRKFI